MRNVKTLGLLGTGVIGGGWAARALHFGIDVIAADVKPEMEAWIRGAVANAEPALARLTFAPLPPKGTLSFTTELRAMAERADFIQENIPEQLALKQRMLAEVSRYAGPDVIIVPDSLPLTLRATITGCTFTFCNPALRIRSAPHVIAAFNCGVPLSRLPTWSHRYVSAA